MQPRLWDRLWLLIWFLVIAASTADVFCASLEVLVRENVLYHFMVQSIHKAPRYLYRLFGSGRFSPYRGINRPGIIF